MVFSINQVVSTVCRSLYKERWSHNRVYGDDFFVEEMLDGNVGFRFKNLSLSFPHLATLKGVFTGKEANLILSGPSIGAISSPALLGSDFCFTVKLSPKFCIQHGLPIDAYLVDDPVRLMEHLPEFIEFSSRSRYVFLSYRSVCVFMKNGVDLSRFPIYVFDYHYFPYRKLRPKTIAPYFAKEAKDGLCKRGTIAYMALQILYCMGFKEVAIFGLDLSSEGHFYKEDSPAPMRFQQKWEEGIEAPFRLVKKICDEESWRVVNCSSVSLLSGDILPKFCADDYLSEWKI